MLKRLRRKIESKRNSKKFFWKTIVLFKDILWKTIILFVFFSLKILTYFNVKKGKFRKAKKFYSISFCITCMNRSSHLKKTLKKNIINNLDYPNIEFVLLDYNSSDDLEEWVFKNLKKYIDSGKLVYYQTKKPKFFNMSNAKNVSHLLAKSDIVCNLDADNFTNKHFAFYINYICNNSKKPIGCLKESKYFQINGCGGRIFLFKKDFERLGGYDERFKGWGFEDNDFYFRSKRIGLEKFLIPVFFLKSINHKDEERTKNTKLNITESIIKNNNQLIKNNKKNTTILKNNLRLAKEIIKNDIIKKDS